jgi:hypothetical protein
MLRTSLLRLQVYDYLERTPAGSQTRESLGSFLKAAEQFKLTKAECLQASNLRPASAVEVHLVWFHHVGLVAGHHF